MKGITKKICTAMGILAVLMFLTTTIFANSITIKMYKTAKSKPGAYIGTIIAKDTKHGLLLTPNLHGLTPGLHGFHMHQFAKCSNSGKAAGDHFDPKHTGKHLGPYNDYGHLGDLPALYANNNGDIALPVLAPRLTVAMLQGHSLIIHEHGDNYTDIPLKLGGGGARVACGKIN